jgi:hypothetical protein
MATTAAIAPVRSRLLMSVRYATHVQRQHGVMRCGCVTKRKRRPLRPAHPARISRFYRAEAALRPPP